MSGEVIDGEAVEVDESIGELVPVQRGAGLQVAPEIGAQDLVRRLDVIREVMVTAMTPDVDYGVIPGTGSKPTLLKPGSEKLGVLFQLDIQIENEKVWDGVHLTVMSRAVVYHAPTGTRLGMGEGLCSTRESKYAYRQAERVCPSCGQAQVRKGKPRDGRPGNWYCWKKFDGCGETWALDSEQGAVFEKMVTGRVDNPDIPETWNTVLKMAEKRARIDAVLAVTGASALFTQDMEAPEVADRDVERDVVSRTDGKEPAKAAKDYGDWVARMAALEVPRAEEWAALAASASEVPAKGRMARLNRVLLWFSDREPASSLGFWSVEEIQAGFAVGFEGVVVALEEPASSASEDDGIEFAPELPLVDEQAVLEGA